MNKQALIEKVNEALGGTKASAEKAVDTLIESIIDTLKKGGEVSIAGLGIFSTKERAQLELLVILVLATLSKCQPCVCLNLELLKP